MAFPRQRQITITVGGEEECDLKDAFDEVVRLIKQGYAMGFNSNETGDFRFEVDDIGSIPATR